MQLVNEAAEYYDSLAGGYHRRSGYYKENDSDGFREIKNLIADLFTGGMFLRSPVVRGTGQQ